jgi:hypothetical protein
MISKKNLINLIAVAVLFPLCSNAQEKKEEPKSGITFSGFVQTDIFYDSRQTVNIREGHFILYPDNVLLDANLKDINASPSFNMLSIQSRLKGTITGPNAFGAKTSGVLEADFFGNENANFSDLNGFRLRHAIIKLNWTKAELMVGQFFHPMLNVESFPEVISFNTGSPFQPFSRNPQIRYTYKQGIIKLIATALTQRDFTGMGPEYTFKNRIYETSTLGSSKYLRNSGIPDLNFIVQLNPDSTEHIFALGVDYKTITPELFTINAAKTKRFASSENLSSVSLFANVKMKFKPVTFRAQAVYAQNSTDLLMLGGYAVKQVSDTATGAKEFTNLNTGSAWIDFSTNGKKLQFGIFGGYTKNMGSADIIATNLYYARGSNIDNVYRVSPRLVFISGKLNISLESEYTSATYGTVRSNGNGKVTEDLNSVENLRGLLAFTFKF